jgi:hypothetical protein
MQVSKVYLFGYVLTICTFAVTLYPYFTEYFKGTSQIYYGFVLSSKTSAPYFYFSGVR